MAAPAPAGRLTRGFAAIRALGPTPRGMLWATSAGLSFALLNTLMKQMSIELPPLQTLFLRYFAGLLIMLPFVMPGGLRNLRTNHLRGQLARGAVHYAGLILWFVALPHLPITTTTALGFTGPIFIMLGATLFLGERMHAVRWLSAAVGLVGVAIVLGPKLGSSDWGYSLLMAASAPVFAASFLLAKMLTRHDSPSVIVTWQALTVSLFALPWALWVWVWPTPTQWLLFLLLGGLGSLGHWALTRAYAISDITTAQPVKFLDLVWAAILGWIFFADIPALATLIGGTLIIAATIWLARRESRMHRDEPAV